MLVWAPQPTRAVILWSDSGTITAHQTGAGIDLLGGAVKRDNSANDTLYFKFRVNPMSDTNTEEYLAAFELFEGDIERMGVGNALKAWAYSAFLNTDESGESNKIIGYIDLRSSHPYPSGSGPVAYELPRRGNETVILFKVQYVPGGDDLVTVWLNPDLGPGATEVYQPESLTTRFNANASFDEIRLRHSGGGEGWTFSEMAIATSFGDFVNGSGDRPGGGPSNPRRAGSFSFLSLSRVEGLPQTAILALARAKDGYLWVGTDDGVARFDGQRFVRFGSREGFSGGRIRALCADHAGALWIATAANGLSRRQDGKFANFTKREGLPADAITSLAEDGEGRLWIGTEAGLATWQAGRLTSVNGGEPFKERVIRAISKDSHGNIWVAVAGAGVFQFRSGKCVAMFDSAAEPLLLDLHCLLVDQHDRVWMGGGLDVVLCREGDEWRRYRLPRRGVRSPVTTLAQETDGTLWAGSADGGLFRIKDGKSDLITASGGLSDAAVASLLVDWEGNLWVGAGTGLNLLRRKNISIFGQNEGLGFGLVQGLAEVAPGVIWACKPLEGLYRWEGRNFSRLAVAGLAGRDPRMNALLVARDGSCWLAGANGLLHYKDPVAAADEVAICEPARLDFISLAEDQEANLWAGTREGQLWRLRQGKWNLQTNCSQAHAITTIVPGADGAMWVGTDGSGLCRVKQDEIQWLDKRNGLRSDQIRALYLDGRGTLWIGTAGGGLSRWHDGRIISVTTREGLQDGSISQIMEDESGRLWLGSNGGILCLSKREVDELAAGNISALSPRVFGRADGMLSEECTGGFSPSGLKTGSGELWFPTLKGVVVADPRSLRTPSSPPRVVLEEVMVDGIPNPGFGAERASADSARALRIGPGKHRLEVRYTGLSFDAPEKVNFRYRLEGLDPDWVEAGNRRLAFYSYVPPGHYRFRVIARGSEGVWTEPGASVAFTVLRHFWQEWWFIGFASIGLLGSVAGGIRFVEKRSHQRRLQQLEQERVLESERTRIARDLHDEMGARLCRISFLSEHARRGPGIPEEVSQQISSISTASREVLHSLDEIVWAVNPKNDTLEHLASYLGHHAEEYFQMTGIECHLGIPPQVPAYPLSSQSRHHLFLAVHEAFTNILKHSGATLASMSIVFNEKELEITISDNGSGFDPSAMRAEQDNSAEASGNGLRNMRQRLTAVGGHCSIESGTGRGATIHFVLPLHAMSPAK